MHSLEGQTHYTPLLVWNFGMQHVVWDVLNETPRAQSRYKKVVEYQREDFELL